MTTQKIDPTEEQQAIVEATKARPESLMVKSYAGCSKTTTLQLSAPGVREPALSLAFNKSIATELAGRLPANFEVKTLNGFGHGAWQRALEPSLGKGFRLKLEEKKLGKLVTEVAKARRVELTSDQWDSMRRLVSGVMQKGLTLENEGNPLVQDTRETWADIADELYIDSEDLDFVYDMSREVLKRNVDLAKQGTISFDDQVYCSVCLGGRFLQYPVVFIDEAQDLSPLNHEMLALALRQGGRLVAVGDPKQCHPLGTLIQMTGGAVKPIEQVNIDDELVSFNRKVGFTGLRTQGAKVTTINVFDFHGELVRVNTENGYTHAITPNHRCLVKWIDKQGYALYLMSKNGQYRIGTAQTWYTSTVSGGFGPSMRARQEKADLMWVLEIFETKEQALIQEKVIWTLFGLPDLIFKSSGKLSSTQEHLDVAWAAIGDNSIRAKECLRYFRREFTLPFWKKGQSLHVGDKTFLIEACNIINAAMAVRCLDESNSWSRVWIDQVSHNGPVIGLTVESNGYGQNLYIANGIVTHNSIYQFRGSDSKSMEKIRHLRPEWLDLPLTTTFRCPKSVVARQQEHAPGFNAWHSNPDGKVLTFGLRTELGEGGWNWKNLHEALPSPMSKLAILCRNNGPLVSMAFKLIRRGIGVVMIGRDIGKGLITLSKKLAEADDLPVDAVRGRVEDWEQAEISKALANDHEERVAGIRDRAECLYAVIESAEVKDAGQLRLALEKLFSRDTGIVTLSSIHKAKGLEWDAVLLLDPWLIPSKYAKQAAAAGDMQQMEQEFNLRYVAETRAKHTLILANLEDFN